MDTMVLKQGEAIAWLKRETSNMIDDYTDNMYSPKEVADMIEEMLGYIDLIHEKNWEWVAIEDCPMSVSTIMVAEMRRA